MTRHDASPAAALVVALLLLAATPLLAPHLVARWRADAPSRLQGIDAQLAEETRRELNDAVRRLRERGGRDVAGVRDAMLAALRDAPWAPGVWTQLASLYQEEHDAARALHSLLVAREIDPMNADVRAHVGNELFFLHGPRAAFADHRAALRLGTSRAAGIHLAWVAAGRDPLDVARALLPPDPRAARDFFLALARVLPLPRLEALWGAFPARGPEAAPVLRALLERLDADPDRVAAASLRARALDRWYRGAPPADATAAEAAGLLLAEGGLFNPVALFPLDARGPGDWTLPPAGRGVTLLRKLRPHYEEPPLAATLPPEAPPAWFSLHFSAFADALREPSQRLRLPGPARYVLRFEVATERLYTRLPVALQVEVTGPGRTLYFRSEGLEGNRRPRVVELAFDVPFEQPGPQVLRLRREAPQPDDPPLTGALHLRFLELRREPLDESLVRRPTDPARVRDLMDQLEAPLFPDGGGSEAPLPGGPGRDAPADEEQHAADRRDRPELPDARDAEQVERPAEDDDAEQQELAGAHRGG